MSTHALLTISVLAVPLALASATLHAQSGDAVTSLMQRAQQHALQHGAHYRVALSPNDALTQGEHAPMNIAAVQKAGFPVIVWTVNDPNRIRELMAQHADGIISDRPDLLLQAAGELKDGDYRSRLDREGHRGGRDLRPENTLPAFESGLDNLITTIETDTGVTFDHISLLSHDQFINPQTCRRLDGAPYADDNKVWIKDIRFEDAQKEFICDRIFRGPEQKNDLALSPVSVAFAKAHGMPSPYSPIDASQLFEFVRFYTDYYKQGPGKGNPAAEERWQNAEKVHFNLETKIAPRYPDHTFGPEVFVAALCGAIQEHRLEERSDIQSFDFRTLVLAQERCSNIPTVYLLEDMKSLLPENLPKELR